MSRVKHFGREIIHCLPACILVHMVMERVIG